MLLVFTDRTTLLSALPAGLTGAEIGTAGGDFAQAILDRTSPSKLHLIDPYRFIDSPDYLPDMSNVDDAEGERRFRFVQDRFATPIGNGQVALHRAASPEIAAQFNDHYFDYVYIDGNHTQSAVAADLDAFDRKVKPEGLIMGHDYVAHPGAKALNFGVVEAVNAFVKKTGYEFLMLTYEGAPSFILAKNRESPLAQRLVSAVLSSMIPAVAIENAEDKTMGQWDVFNEQGERMRTLLAFR